MAISKFTTPIQASPIPTRPRVNLNLVSDTLNRLSASQAEGEEARTTFEILRQNLKQNVIPGEEGLADQYLKEAELGIDMMSEEPNLINAASRIRSRGVALTGKFSRLSENKALLNEAIASSQKLMADGEQSRANRFFSIEMPLQEHVPGTPLSLGQQRKYIDVPKMLSDQMKSFKNEKNETIVLTDDGWINTTTTEGVDPQRVKDAARALINNNPAIRTQLIEDVRFDLFQQPTEFVDAQLGAQVAQFDLRRQQIQNSGQNEEDKAANLAALAKAQDELVEDPESFIVKAEVENRINRLIEPVVLRESGIEVSLDTEANPYSLIRLREAISGGGSGSGGLALFGPQHQTNVVEPEVGIAKTVDITKATVEKLNDYIANAPPGSDKNQALLDRDFAMTQLQMQEFKRDEILRRNGMDPDAYEEYLATKSTIALPFGFTDAQTAAIENRRGFGRDFANFSNMPKILFPDGLDEKAAQKYLRAVDDWKDGAGSLLKDMERVVDRELRQTEQSTVSVLQQAVPEKHQRDVLQFANNDRSVAGIFIRKSDGEVMNTAEELKGLPIEFNETGPMNLMPVNGAYSVTVYDKNDKDGERYTHMFTDKSGRINDWVGDTFELSHVVDPRTLKKAPIHEIPFAEEVMSVRQDWPTPIIRNGQNILPGGSFLKFSGGAYSFVDKMGKPIPGEPIITDVTEMIGTLQELEADFIRESQ